MITISSNIPTQTLPKLFDRLNLANLNDNQRNLISQIDNLLPQTQCGLCGHADGCLPYATAILTQNEAHNQCVPGGQPVTDQIAQLLGRPHLTAEPSQWQIDPTTHRPTEMRAIIREDDCIGCTKCIPACPVDAIIGSGKRMHTIFTDLCTGCELCIEPCPVDCIELVAFPRVLTESEREVEQADLRRRYHAHLYRVESQVNDVTNVKPVVSMVQAKLINSEEMAVEISESQAKNTIEQAKLRTQIKKLEKQLAVRTDENKQRELDGLKQKLNQF